MTDQTSNDTHSFLVEAESFKDYGGWKLDTQFIHIMGSPYLLAHGLGNPVAPARTRVTLPAPGRWYIWARTKNWVPGPWQAPGRFRLSVNAHPLDHVFGAGAGEWAWECGGSVDVEQVEIELGLIDLTGFDGRCDAIFLSSDENEVPDNSSTPMTAWRREHGRNIEVKDSPIYDLVVVGGGIAGTTAAISAARMGLSVALLQDRLVLGGNASPEIRVACGGNFPPGNFPQLGDIVKELTSRKVSNAEYPGGYEEIEQHIRSVVSAEPTLELFLGKHVYQVETAGGHITAVWALDAHACEVCRYTSRFFVDATGHGTLGLYAGGDYDLQPRDRMGMSNLWRWQFTDRPSSFPETPWALPLTERGFPYPGDEKIGKGDWYWESGFNAHPLNDLESTRDHNLRAVYGAWNAIKNHGAYAARDSGGQSHATAELMWLAYIGGTRETLQLLGDVVVCKEDITNRREFPDACVPATWGIDLHYPLPLFERETPDNPFISRAHFGGKVDDSQGEWADSAKASVRNPEHESYDREAGYLFPYRAFYSRNIDNLFMAGRNISVTHDALGTVRVMNTLGMIGVVVGRAAGIACANQITPRGVYEQHLAELKELLSLPGDYRA